jgi:hypothetical protein
MHSIFSLSVVDTWLRINDDAIAKTLKLVRHLVSVGIIISSSADFLTALTILYFHFDPNNLEYRLGSIERCIAVPPICEAEGRVMSSRTSSTDSCWVYSFYLEM